jgi:hypothetical protein
MATHIPSELLKLLFIIYVNRKQKHMPTTIITKKLTLSGPLSYTPVTLQTNPEVNSTTFNLPYLSMYKMHINVRTKSIKSTL